MVVPGRCDSEWEDVQLLDAKDEAVRSIEMAPYASGWLGLSDTSSIDAASFLDGTVRLRRPAQNQALQRRPRRLVPLRWDELLQSFLECERVQLGEDSLVLSRTELAPRVAEFLDRAARPGYRNYSDLRGLPIGWTLFADVQILVSGERELLVDLSVLQPIARSQVVVQGGLRMPGYLRKWSSKRPPELRVTSEEGSEIDARLTCKRPLARPTPPDAIHRGSGCVLIWDLADLDLPDGDYEITVGSNDLIIGTELVRLRSADNPSLQLDSSIGSIGHHPGQPGYGLLASTDSTGEFFQVSTDPYGPLGEAAVPSVPSWWSARATTTSSRTRGGVISFPPNGSSCLRGHYMELPMGLDGQTSIEGICRNCGLVKRYPTRFRRKIASTAAQPAPPNIGLGSYPRVRAQTDIDWSVAFDAVCHVGSGSISALKRIPSQMEATDLFGDAFARRLEVTAHIEIARSKSTLAGIAWQTNDPTIIGLPSGDSVIVGFRSDRLLVALEDEVWKAGGELDIASDASAPPVLKVVGLDPETLQRLAKAMELATDRPVRVIADASTAIGIAAPQVE